MCFESRFSKELIAIWSALMKMAVLCALCVLWVSKTLAGSAKRNAKSAKDESKRQGRQEGRLSTLMLFLPLFGRVSGD
jgi:hypothetical protein